MLCNTYILCNTSICVYVSFRGNIFNIDRLKNYLIILTNFSFFPYLTFFFQICFSAWHFSKIKSGRPTIFFVEYSFFIFRLKSVSNSFVTYPSSVGNYLDWVWWKCDKKWDFVHSFVPSCWDVKYFIFNSVTEFALNVFSLINLFTIRIFILYIIGSFGNLYCQESQLG